MPKNQKRVREQAVVYLGQHDRTLLDTLASQTGLSRTELFRRGLWALASQLGVGDKAGSGFEHLIGTAGAATGPSDLAERADDYLYGGGYRTWVAREPSTSVPAPAKSRKKRARLR